MSQKGNSKSKNTPRTPEAVAASTRRKTERRLTQADAHRENVYNGKTAWDLANEARASKRLGKQASHRAAVAARVDVAAKASREIESRQSILA